MSFFQSEPQLELENYIYIAVFFHPFTKCIWWNMQCFLTSVWFRNVLELKCCWYPFHIVIYSVLGGHF